MNQTTFWILGIMLLMGCGSVAQQTARRQNVFGVSGYTSVKLDEATHRISYWGESVTTSAASADFGRLQAATLAEESGYHYFMIGRYFVTPPIHDTVSASPDPSSPSPTAPLDLPTNTLIIECFKERPVEASSAVHEANATAKRIRTQYGVR
ncbi:MAG: hypothetical protein KTQ49_08015 [Candidatus Omnitrophica bacterium]|nr:hypothetical protein [Candidatus Omnitrophota bacterium]